MATTRPKRVPHIITVGAQKLMITLPDEYEGIGTSLGIVKVTGDTDVNDGATSADLLKSGKGVKIKVRYGDATNAKTAIIICSIDKAKTAVHDLLRQRFRGLDIRSAYFPRRARLS